MDRRERVGDPEETFRVAFEGGQARMWTALPGIVVKFDPARMVANIKPTIKGLMQTEKGILQWVEMPVLLDCPVVFPQGGGVTLTFPIAEGDEVLVVFASRCIDSWWQLGGVQNQAELRMHDLSDGFAIPGARSQPRKFAVSTTAAQLRTDDGSAYVELNPSNKGVTVQTTGKAKVNADTIEATANSATVTASTISLVGNVTVTGNLSVSGSMTNAGKNIGKTHTHSGVQTGGGNTGVVN